VGHLGEKRDTLKKYIFHRPSETHTHHYIRTFF